MNGHSEPARRGCVVALGALVGTGFAIWYFRAEKCDYAAIKAASTPPYTAVTSDNLLREYEDVAGADDRYKNKVVCITGPVTEPQSSKVATACVVLSGKGDGLFPVAVNCFLADGGSDKQKHLKVGETITVLGVVEGKIFRGISVQAATIESQEEGSVVGGGKVGVTTPASVPMGAPATRPADVSPVSIVGIMNACATPALIAGCLAVLIALLRLPKLIRRWVALKRVYGVAPVTLAMDVWRYAAGGSLQVLQRLSLTGFLVGAVVLMAASWLESHLSGPGPWGCFSFGCGFLYIVSSLDIATPPAILLLGPSSPELERLLASLNRDFPQFRTVALLRPGQAALSAGYRWSAFSNNFYARDLYQWRLIVFHLMDVVPLVILCDDKRRAVEEERRRLQMRGYIDRTFTTQPGLLANPTERRRLRDWLIDRLRHVADQEVRLTRQLYFVRMRSSVPGQFWYPKTVQQVVAKAKLLERFALTGFLETCKRGGVAAYSGQLLEDIPSAVSRAEELQYLRQDRAFEEIEVLLRSANDVVQGTGDYAEFNEANLYNKRGLLARFRGEWERAEREIETAIRLLTPMTSSSSSHLAAIAFQEIGTAYYNLGDVFLARCRETKNSALRDRAKECYRLSVVNDEKGGGDTGLAQERLRSM
jgi:hypothetical protein